MKGILIGCIMCEVQWGMFLCSLSSLLWLPELLLAGFHRLVRGGAKIQMVICLLLVLVVLCGTSLFFCKFSSKSTGACFQTLEV